MKKTTGKTPKKLMKCFGKSKINILFGYSAFMKELSEEQKGRDGAEAEELGL